MTRQASEAWGMLMGEADRLVEEQLEREARLNGYAQFLARKLQYGSAAGIRPLWMPSSLFDFQSFLVDWALNQGRCALFADCGMGKTLMEMVWAENMVRHSNKHVLILTPLAVAQQFVREGEKFGIGIKRCNTGKVSGRASIWVTNYEKLHLFDCSDFGAVVCDESSSIKAFDGKRRAEVTEFLRTIPYRLLATATPAPNDYIELGTSSEALGVMGQVEMLNRFFKNDNNTSDTKKRWKGFAAPRELAGPGWRFKGHAEIPFMRWVSSWARACRRPSDLGFPDDRFVLPQLIEREHVIDTRTLAPGMLFAMAATNRQEELEERRRTIPERCEFAADLVNGTGEPFVMWCQLNDEGDLLEKLIPDAIQVKGSDCDEEKEEAYEAFSSGQSRGIITKHKIGAWGLNWQHCAHVVEFADHSYEQHYQGTRRCWRFGQTRDVVNDIITTEGQRGIKENMRRKANQADRMFSLLVEQMGNAIRIEAGQKYTQEVELPKW